MIEKKILDKYNDELKKFGSSDRRSLFWTKDKQDMRFNLLLDSKLKLSNMSILDYGCGFADLNHYLKRNFFSLKYSGCDINYNFIDIARRNHPKEDIFLINSIDDISNNYDIILASGTFNLLEIENEISMKEYVFCHLKKLFDKTNYLLTVNFLSHLTDCNYRYKGHFYLDPRELYEFGISNMTKRICIDSSSLPYEITVKFFKNENIDNTLSIWKEF